MLFRSEIYRRVLAHPREPQKKSSGLGRALSPSRGRGDRSPTRFPLRPEHAALAEKKLAEAEKMVASFGEMLADMEADLAQAEGRAADAAAVSFVVEVSALDRRGIVVMDWSG